MPGRTRTALRPGVRLAGNTTVRPRMWHAAWRQHRAWVLVTLALAAAGALLLVAAAVLVPACASTEWWKTPGATCGIEPANTFWNLFELGLRVGPVLVGAILGAVTFGSDVEHRTQVFSLTQGVSRLRWWAAKVAVVGGTVFVAFALLGLATLWAVNASANSVISVVRLNSPGFGLLGLIPATRFLIAYAAAAAAALLWRTVGGLVTGLVLAGVLITIGTLLQPLVVAHHSDLIPIKAWLNDDTGALNPGFGTAYQTDGYTDAAGREIDSNTLDCGNESFDVCVQGKVTYRLETYVTDEQFPRMTVIISGLNLLLAGALLGAGAQAVRRRDL